MAGLLDADKEGWARLQGMLAMLALPPIRLSDGTHRRRVVEVEVSPGSDRWIAIDGITLEDHRIICWCGANGSRQAWEFMKGEQIPRWRMADSAPRPKHHPCDP